MAKNFGPGALGAHGAGDDESLVGDSVSFTTPDPGTEGTFSRWQREYARHGISTFPVRIVGGDKKPMVTGYAKIGVRGSAELARKFPDAESLGFMCGRQNGITVVDMDSTDPAIVDEGERLFGRSPVLWQTGGGKWAAAYRFNGESRRIRPIPSLPIDLLGSGGFVVAPPSAGATRRYQIIRGSLDDFDRLPVARIPEELLPGSKPHRGSSGGELIPKGRRNSELFAYCSSIVAYCDTPDQLIDAARTWADGRLALPLPTAEITKTCNSVWQHRGGRRRIMNQIVEGPQWAELVADPEILGVFAYLAAENGPDSEFMVADCLAEARGWPRRLVPAAREKLLALGLIRCTRRPAKNTPGLYRWSQDLDLPNLVGNPYSPLSSVPCAPSVLVPDTEQEQWRATPSAGALAADPGARCDSVPPLAPPIPRSKRTAQ